MNNTQNLITQVENFVLYTTVGVTPGMGCMMTSLAAREALQVSCLDMLRLDARTPAGRRRISTKDAARVRQAGQTCLSLVEKMHTEFGYWHEGAFYSAKKGSTHNTTAMLHDMQLPQSVWDSMRHGIYYTSNLAVWYEEAITAQPK